MTPEKLWKMNGPKKDKETTMKNKIDCGCEKDVFACRAHAHPQHTPELCGVCGEKLANHEDETPCNKPQHTPTPPFKLTEPNYDTTFTPSIEIEGNRYAIQSPTGEHASIAIYQQVVLAVNAYEKDQEIKRELLAVLKNTLRSLEQHLKDATVAAKPSLKHVSLLCPCWDNEVKQAREAIAKAEDQS